MVAGCTLQVLFSLATVCHLQIPGEFVDSERSSTELVGWEGSRDLRVSVYHARDSVVIHVSEACCEHLDTGNAFFLSLTNSTWSTPSRSHGQRPVDVSRSVIIECAVSWSVSHEIKQAAVSSIRRDRALRTEYI